MFAALGRSVYRLRWGVLLAAVVLVLPAALVSRDVNQRLTPGGWELPSSESFQAARALDRQLGVRSSDIVVVFHSERWRATDPIFAEAMKQTLQPLLSDARVKQVDTYYSGGTSAFISADGHTTYALVDLKVQYPETLRVAPELRAKVPQVPIELHFTGLAPTYAAFQQQSEHDLRRAELIALPAALVVLLLVFGSGVAASLPVALGILSIGLGSATLALLARGLSVSVFALNILVSLGLALAIDYSLFIVSRFREELGRSGGQVAPAVVTTVATAGRAVAFSGLAVMIGLAGMALLPLGFFRSLALAGVLIVALSVVGALTVLPALLAVLGSRVDRLRVLRPRPPALRPCAGAGTTRADGPSRWERIAGWVMRRAPLVAAGVVTLLLVLGIPFLHVRLGMEDVRALPHATDAYRGYALLERSFPPNEVSPTAVFVRSDVDLTSPAGVAALREYALRLAAQPGVQRVDSVVTFLPNADTATYQRILADGPDGLRRLGAPPLLARMFNAHAAELRVVSEYVPNSREDQALVLALRQVRAPEGFHPLVGGSSAALADIKAAVTARTPLVVAVVVLAMLVVLVFVFRSVVLPVKAVVMDGLSITASYGVLVWGFQDGHLQGLLRFHSTGTVDVTLPVLMFGVLFGLSMDYEVFLLSRMREEYDRSGNTTEAVAAGLARTGRVITSAAALQVVVFGAMIAGGLEYLKAMGVGMALAVALDATLVRVLLVPALMRLLGRWNWWAPAPLRALWGEARRQRHAPAK